MQLVTPLFFSILYMEPMLHRHAGTVELTFFPKGSKPPMWHGIQKILVPADKREAFDAGLFPSLFSCSPRGRMHTPRSAQSAAPVHYKTVHRIWRRSGFVETVLPDGSLQFTCNFTSVRRGDHPRQRAERHAPAAEGCASVTGMSTVNERAKAAETRAAALEMLAQLASSAP